MMLLMDRSRSVAYVLLAVAVVAHLALTFQACDATTCLRPETLELAIP